MDILKIALLSLSSITVLFILTKLMGAKQMSQLSMFDYINGITIGSIAAEMATNLEEFHKPLTAMAVYTFVVIMISFINSKSVKFRRITTGKPLILYEDGKLYKQNLKKSKLELNEFLTQCRGNGYFDLSKIQTAILEANGKISFLPVSYDRPVTTKDMALKPEPDSILVNVIIDGKIMEKNLSHTGKDRQWLIKQLASKGIQEVSSVFLVTCDKNHKLNIYKKIEDEMARDVFE